MSYGVKMILIAGLAFAVMNVFIKYIPHIPAVEIVFFRSLISLVISLFAIRRSKVALLGNNKAILFLRGAFGTAGLLGFFYTLQHMPLAAATVIHYISPVFTGLFAMLFLKEKMIPRQYLFLTISLIGVIMVYGYDIRVNSYELMIGLTAAACSAAAYNCIRKLQLSENPNVIILYFPMIALPVSLVIMYFAESWVMPSGWDWLLLLFIGLFTQLAQYCLTLAYQHEESTKIAPVTYFGLIYALIFGFILFNESFGFIVLAGMILVVLGVVLNIFISSNRFIKKGLR